MTTNHHTAFPAGPTAPGAELTSSNMNAPFSALDSAISAIIGADSANPLYRVGASSELTIASGVVTITKSHHTIDTQSDDASDDLDTMTIATSNVFGVIRAAHTDRTVVVKHNTGNILTWDGNDVSLDDTNKALLYYYDGTSVRILSIIAAGGGGGGAPTDAQYLTLALDGDLSAERVLVANQGIALADGGANGNATLTMNMGAAQGVSLASDVLAAGSNRNVVVDSESSTSDDLIEITGLSVGQHIWLVAAAGHTITVRHNDAGATNKIHLNGNTDVVLDEDNPLVLCQVDTNVLAQVLETSAGGGSGDTLSQFLVGDFTPGSNILSSSTSYVDISASIQQAATLSGGEKVIVRFDFKHMDATSTNTVTLQVVADNSGEQADDDTIEVAMTITGAYAESIEVIFTGLSSGTWTFKPQWKTTANNARILAGAPVKWTVKVYS